MLVCTIWCCFYCKYKCCLPIRSNAIIENNNFLTKIDAETLHSCHVVLTVNMTLQQLSVQESGRKPTLTLLITALTPSDASERFRKHACHILRYFTFGLPAIEA